MRMLKVVRWGEVNMRQISFVEFVVVVLVVVVGLRVDVAD